MFDGWREIVPKEWADCILHNPPIGFIEKRVDKLKIQVKICSLYELSKSATNWQFPDFNFKR